jgi:hypothetical protein
MSPKRRSVAFETSRQFPSHRPKHLSRKFDRTHFLPIRICSNCGFIGRDARASTFCTSCGKQLRVYDGRGLFIANETLWLLHDASMPSAICRRIGLDPDSFWTSRVTNYRHERPWMADWLYGDNSSIPSDTVQRRGWTSTLID